MSVRVGKQFSLKLNISGTPMAQIEWRDATCSSLSVVTEEIPFNRPHLTGAEFAHISDAVSRGHLSGDGHFTRRCHQLLAQLTGVPDVLLSTSCTHALEMAALLLDVVPGDEVIVPSFTFTSSVNAFVLRGARPVFVDIRADTLNLDERLIEEAITPRTRAIVVVHYAGVGCDMDSIMALAEQHGVSVVEDNAHGLGARYRQRPLGSFGVFATQSFHETKNVHCGEGGALLINDARYVGRAERIREKGTNRSEFFRGAVDKYTWVEAGSSYLPSDMLAAFLSAQLESFDEIHASRHRIWDTYHSELAGWAAGRDILQPTIPDHCEHPAHLYYLLLPDLDQRQRFIGFLAERGIRALFHYVPLHRSPKGQALGGSDARCPVTDAVSDRLVRLPLFPDLSDRDLERVIDAVRSFDTLGG